MKVAVEKKEMERICSMIQEFDKKSNDDMEQRNYEKVAEDALDKLLHVEAIVQTLLIVAEPVRQE